MKILYKINKTEKPPKLPLLERKSNGVYAKNSFQYIPSRTTTLFQEKFRNNQRMWKDLIKKQKIKKLIHRYLNKTGVHQPNPKSE